MRRYIYIFGLTVLFWGTSCADFINIQPENTQIIRLWRVANAYLRI
jgi:hypothetical protein